VSISRSRKCNQWQQWTPCDNGDTLVRIRKKEHSYYCKSANFQVQNCIYRRLKGLLFEDPGYDDGHDLIEECCICDHSVCHFFEDKVCAGYCHHSYEFRYGSQKDSISIRLPGILYNVMLEKPRYTLTRLNILECMEECGGWKECIAVSFIVEKGSNNCFLFDKKIYRVSTSSKLEYMTWFSAPGFVQSFSMKGIFERKVMSNPHACAALCESREVCKAITFHGNKCYFYDVISEYVEKPNEYASLSWFRYQN
jgi:hypothetical protein